MSCDRYTGAIVDHACGAEISADAAAHLKVCAACSRTFDEQRRLLQDLDQELQVALAIEPSARFVADVMTGVERSAQRRRAISLVERPCGGGGRARPARPWLAAIRRAAARRSTRTRGCSNRLVGACC